MSDFLLSAPVDLDPAVRQEGLTYEKEVVYSGNFVKDLGNNEQQRFTVDEALIDHWIKTHTELTAAGVKVPMPVSHTRDVEATRAHVKSLTKKLDHKGRMGLFATLEFTKQAYADQLSKTDVSLYSPREIKHQGKTFVRPIEHICFTSYPSIGDLADFTIACSMEAPQPATPPTPPTPKTPPTAQPKGSVMIKAIVDKLGIVAPEGATDEALAGMIYSKFESLKPKADAKKPDGKDVQLENETVVDPIVKPAVIDPMVIELTNDNRSMKIDTLVADRKITPARGKALKTKFVAEGTLALSNDVFSAVYSELEALDPIVALSRETSGSQRTSEMKESSLVANARKMAEARKK